MITDHKVLVAILKKDVAGLSFRLQRIPLQIHQCNIRILYKLGLQMFIKDGLYRHNHKTNTDEEMSYIYIT